MSNVQQLEAMTSSQLVARYNELTGQQVKKFSSKKAGIARILKVLPAQEVAPPARKSRAPSFNLDAKREIRNVRPDTKRATVIDMLRKGTTVEDVMDAIGWDRRTALEGIRLINTYVGYGLRQDDDGIITLES